LDNCWHGFFFGPFSTLSDQGIMDQWNTHNRWLGTYDQGSSQFKLSTVSGNWIGPQIHWYEYQNEPNIYQVDSYLLNQNPVHPCYTRIIPPWWNSVDVNSCNFPGEEYIIIDSIGDTIQRSRVLGKYLSGINQYDTLQEQFHFYEKSFLFDYLTKNTSLINLGGVDDMAYLAVVDSLANTDIGNTNNFYRQAKSFNLDSAHYFNQRLSDTNVWIHNRRIVNDIYLRTWALDQFVFNAADSSQLMSIALQTPYEGGDAVYSARVMLNVDPDIYGVAYSKPITGPGFAKKGLKIYPNPSADQFNIEIPGLDPGLLTIEYYGTMGNLVSSTRITAQSSIIRLNVSEIKNGLYLLVVRAESGILGIGKICVLHY
jgi:hypothetical protein